MLPSFRRLALAVALIALARWGYAADAAKMPSPDHAVVPGFERFYTGAKTDGVKGGRLLLSELNCTSCHVSATTAEGSLGRKQAPILDGVASRVRRSFLRKFLNDPQAVKPGSTMPKMFADLPEKERAENIEALVHFLSNTGTLKQEQPNKKAATDGKNTYHKVGCVACHGSRDSLGNVEKALPTSVPLGDLRGKYSVASLATFLQNPHAVRPSGRMPGLLLQPKEANEVANFLLQGIAFATFGANMSYAYYEGNWEKLPDFAGMKPKAKGESKGFELALARRQNDMAMRFEGYLKVPGDGDYKFHVTSDDGSKLLVDDKLVVDHDGIHAPSSKTGSVKLTKGTHKLVVGIFNGGGGCELHVDIEGPGLGRQDVSSLVTLTPEGNPKVEVPPELKEDVFDIQPTLVTKGRELFASAGCASCHTMSAEKKRIDSTLKAPELAKLNPEAGCLAKAPAKGAPAYSLNVAQRASLAAAIKAPTAAAKPEPADLIMRTFVAFNCFACHERGKVGGLEEGLNALFTTTEKEMGEEGRVPPFLDGVGAKMTKEYLTKIFGNGSKDRPYMHTRMPKYGTENIGHLVATLEAVDHLPVIPKVAYTENPQKVKSSGRHLVGGQALGCVKCHTFAGHKAEGVQGIDMTILTQRLRRDWFHAYLLDPQKVRPGTRMPQAWPGGQSMLPMVLGGDTAKQIESIWLYLGDGTKAALPTGLNKKSIPLVPDKEAIIYRNFIQGAGARGIAVGYPEKAHYAFDANNLCIALIWQGDFIDAAKHWTDRGVGFEGPMGDNILALAIGVPFAILEKEDAPWPNKSAKDLGYHFKGYKVTKDERPTFFYEGHGVKIEDFTNAVASKPLPSLKRTLTLTAEKPIDGFFYRAAVADKIEAVGDGWYKINGEWKMKIEGGTPQIRKAGGKVELLVPVKFNNNQAKLVQEYVW